MAVTRVDGGPTPARAFDLIELRVDLAASYANPFDPADVKVTASVEDGLDTFWVDGFWFQDYAAVVTDGVERLALEGEPHFRLRLRFEAAGTWTVRISASDADGEARAVPVELAIVAPETPARGFVRVDRDDPTRLSWSDGTTYLAWGANVCWVGYDEGTAGFARYFDRLSENGLTWTRVWMTHFDATALEWSAGDGGAYQGLGRYNLQAAWRVDRILGLAEVRGVALQLVLQQHSQFETSNWSSWAENPWNQANSGPLAASGDFFTDEAVVAAFDRKLAYLVARYAHSPGLLAWELFNEVELIEGARKADFEAWTRARDQVLQLLDRYHHPVTSSYSAPCWTGCTQPWGDEAYDLPQVHSYLPDYWLALRKAAAQMRTYGKPAIAGEVGIDFLGEKNLADVEGAHLVNLTLLAALLGFEGGGMSWWWDNWIEPNGLWSVLGRAARALEDAGIALWRAPLEGFAAEAEIPFEVVAAETSFGAIVWLHDPRSDWDQAFPAGPEGEVQAVVALPATLDCRFGSVVFLDPWGAAEPTTASGPSGALTTPSFRRDLLVRLDCPPPPADDLGSAEADGAPVEVGGEVVPADEARSSGGCSVTSFR